MEKMRESEYTPFGETRCAAIHALDFWHDLIKNKCADVPFEDIPLHLNDDAFTYIPWDNDDGFIVVQVNKLTIGPELKETK